jgi:hypothetical protein
MWQVTDRGWLYIVGDSGRAGNSIVALAVRATGRKSVVLDPGGNSIGIIEITGDG